MGLNYNELFLQAETADFRQAVLGRITMNINKLFRFEKTEDGYVLSEFSQNSFFDNMGEVVTETEIPDKYKEIPVTAIGGGAFKSACY